MSVVPAVTEAITAGLTPYVGATRAASLAFWEEQGALTAGYEGARQVYKRARTSYNSYKPTAYNYRDRSYTMPMRRSYSRRRTRRPIRRIRRTRKFYRRGPKYSGRKMLYYKQKKRLHRKAYGINETAITAGQLKTLPPGQPFCRDVTQGLTMDQRIGDSIFLRGIRLRWVVRNSLSLHTFWVRMMLCVQTGGDINDSNNDIDFFQGLSTAPHDFSTGTADFARVHYPINKKKYQPMWQKTLKIGCKAGQAQHYTDIGSKFLKVNRRLQYQAISTTNNTHLSPLIRLFYWIENDDDDATQILDVLQIQATTFFNP